MDLLSRITVGVLYVVQLTAFLVLTSVASAEAPDEYYATQPVEKLSCSNPNVYGSNTCPPSGANPNKTEVHREQTGVGSGSDPSVYWRYYYCNSEVIQNGITYPYLGWDTNHCYFGEPPPPPECNTPIGTTKGFSTPTKTSTVCSDNCRFNKASGSICTFTDSGTSSCWAEYTSDGYYCAGEDGPTSNFDDQLDDDNCYSATANGQKYCESPDDSPCPNYTYVNGKKYCNFPSEAGPAPDSDGDGSPDAEDPNPTNPDTDGDGTPDGQDGAPTNPDFDGDGIPDGEDPDDDNDGVPDFVDYNGNNPDSDGDGIPDGQDTDANGNGVQDEKEEKDPTSSYEGGTCTAEQRQEPNCESDDPVECGILLNTWHQRCDDELFREELSGTDDYNAQGDSLLNGESQENQVSTSEIGFDSFLDGLDDSGTGFGGSNSCPADIQISVDPFGSIAIPFTFICDFASKIRPLVIALGWLAAGFIAFRSMTEK